MRRIQRAIDKEDVVKALTDGEQPCFKEIFRLLIFAAMLGMKLRRREPLQKADSGKAVPETYFTNSPVWPGLIYLIGLVETSSTDVLRGTDEANDTLVKVFEEFANGGLAYLKEFFEERELGTVELVALINDLTTLQQPPKPNLVDIGI